MPYMSMRTAALIVAAGSGTRIESKVSKQYLELRGVPVVSRTLAVFKESGLFDEIVLVLPKEDVDTWGKKLLSEHLAPSKVCIKITSGGDSRQESVAKGLLAMSDDIDIVAIHDGVRPFVEVSDIELVLKRAISDGAATLGVRVTDSIKKVDWQESKISESVDRTNLCAVKTPQAFKVDLIKEAHERAKKDGFLGSDDCALVERIGYEVMIVEGSSDNLKITTKEDLILAEGILAKRSSKSERMQEEVDIRTGIGYDAHRLVVDRPLVLGGVVIPFSKGLQGHSDADVLIHSICDALLGAACLGDIGVHFPDTNEEFSGISSLILLERVSDILKQNAFKVTNIDATIVAQAPKLTPFFSDMINNISKATSLNDRQINIKATTTEGMGFTGTGEGISAYSVATIVRI